MKSLSKLIAVALTATALFLTSNVKAQTTPAHALNFGIGIDAGIPTGALSSSSSFMIGGTGRFQYAVSNNFAITLTSGYESFLGKQRPSGTTDYPNLNLVPLTVGIKDFFSKSIYFGAEGGAGFVTNANGHTKLILSPTLGWANKSWDIGINYQNVSGQSYDYGAIGLRVGFAL